MVRLWPDSVDRILSGLKRVKQLGHAHSFPTWKAVSSTSWSSYLKQPKPVVEAGWIIERPVKTVGVGEWTIQDAEVLGSKDKRPNSAMSGAITLIPGGRTDRHQTGRNHEARETSSTFVQ